MAMIPSPNPSLPPYIERGGEVVYSPPGFARGVHMYAYLLRADTDRLQQMFHRYLNEPGGGAVDIVPAGSTVVLNVVRLDRVGALTMPDHARGYFSELEMAVWTLAYDRRSGRYLTFVPYMVVDRGSAMAMGREVYGFPKQLGVVSFPDEQERAFRVDVDAVRTWDADTEFTRQRLVTIPSVQTQFGQPPVDFTTQEQLVRELARAAADDRGLLSVATGAGTSGDLDHLAGAVQLLVSRTLPMVFLKQIRDARQPTRACYQAIHTANFEVTDFRGAGRLRGSPTVLLDDYDNVPICRELGLDGCRPATDGNGSGGTRHELVPIDSFWVDFDFNLTVAEEVWVHPQSPSVAASVSISTGVSGGRRGR